MKPTVWIKDDFASLLEYQAWANASLDNLSELNSEEINRFDKERVEKTIYRQPTWFGQGANYKELAEGVKEYQRPDLLESIYNQVSHELSISVTNRIKARRLKFNSLGLGIFCFDRAAMTLYRNKEFFSESHNSPVDIRDISPTEKGYVLNSDGSEVIHRWEQKADGLPKVRTHTKELFGYFPETQKNNHAVEFFIAGGGSSSLEANELLYCGISAIVLAELLIKAGIKVKINVVMGSSLSPKRKEFVGCILTVKQYDEILDRNLIALLTSDPRFIRFDMFKGIVATFEHFGKKVPYGLGYPNDAIQIETILEQSGYNKKSQAKHRYYFGGIFNEDDALNNINETIKDIAERIGV